MILAMPLAIMALALLGLSALAIRPQLGRPHATGDRT